MMEVYFASSPTVPWPTFTPAVPAWIHDFVNHHPSFNTLTTLPRLLLVLLNCSCGMPTKCLAVPTGCTSCTTSLHQRHHHLQGRRHLTWQASTSMTSSQTRNPCSSGSWIQHKRRISASSCSHGRKCSINSHTAAISRGCRAASSSHCSLQRQTCWLQQHWRPLALCCSIRQLYSWPVFHNPVAAPKRRLAIQAVSSCRHPTSSNSSSSTSSWRGFMLNYSCPELPCRATAACCNRSCQQCSAWQAHNNNSSSSRRGTCRLRRCSL